MRASAVAAVARSEAYACMHVYKAPARSEAYACMHVYKAPARSARAQERRGQSCDDEAAAHVAGGGRRWTGGAESAQAGGDGVVRGAERNQNFTGVVLGQLEQLDASLAHNMRQQVHARAPAPY